MKHLKAKLMATVMSLTLSMLMLTSASFAWFTISTAPEVRDMSANVAANNNLEIALATDDGATGGFKAPAESAVGDAGKNTTWGNLVDLKGYFQTSGATPSNKITLKPVQATFTNGVPAFSYPQFGNDGRIFNVSGLTRKSVGSQGNPQYDDMGGLYAFTDNASSVTGENVWAYEVDYWLRTNVEGPIGLTLAAKRGDSNSEEGAGSFISNNKITVKFVLYTPTVAENGTVTLGTPTKEFDVTKTLNETSHNYDLTLKGVGDSSSTFQAQPGTKYLMKMYVYFDGAASTNANLAGSTETCLLNVQFKNYAENFGSAMEVSENGYGKNTANTGANGLTGGATAYTPPTP